MTKRYKSEKGVVIGCALGATMLLLCGLVFMLPGHGLANPAVLVIVLLLAVLFGWIWFGTSYSVDEQYLYYVYGPFRGKIALPTIQEVLPGQTRWSGFRPALARNGIVIKYGRWDEIYISPKHQKEFVDALILRNASIVVK